MVSKCHPCGTGLRGWHSCLEGYQLELDGACASIRGIYSWFSDHSGIVVSLPVVLSYLLTWYYPKSPDANATLNITDGCYLGRPWNDWAVTVYLNTFMEDIIQPVGWEAFDSARWVVVLNPSWSSRFLFLSFLLRVVLGSWIDANEPCSPRRCDVNYIFLVQADDHEYNILCWIQLYWYVPRDDLHSLEMFSDTQDPAETPQVVYPSNTFSLPNRPKNSQ